MASGKIGPWHLLLIWASLRKHHYNICLKILFVRLRTSLTWKSLQKGSILSPQLKVDVTSLFPQQSNLFLLRFLEGVFESALLDFCHLLDCSEVKPFRARKRFTDSSKNEVTAALFYFQKLSETTATQYKGIRYISTLNATAVFKGSIQLSICSRLRRIFRR